MFANIKANLAETLLPVDSDANKQRYTDFANSVSMLKSRVDLVADSMGNYQTDTKFNQIGRDAGAWDHNWNFADDVDQSMSFLMANASSTAPTDYVGTLQNRALYHVGGFRLVNRGISDTSHFLGEVAGAPRYFKAAGTLLSLSAGTLLVPTEMAVAGLASAFESGIQNLSNTTIGNGSADGSFKKTVGEGLKYVGDNIQEHVIDFLTGADFKKTLEGKLDTINKNTAGLTANEMRVLKLKAIASHSVEYLAKATVGLAIAGVFAVIGKIVWLMESDNFKQFIERLATLISCMVAAGATAAVLGAIGYGIYLAVTAISWGAVGAAFANPVTWIVIASIITAIALYKSGAGKLILEGLGVLLNKIGQFLKEWVAPALQWMAIKFFEGLNWAMVKLGFPDWMVIDLDKVTWVHGLTILLAAAVIVTLILGLNGTIPMSCCTILGICFGISFLLNIYQAIEIKRAHHRIDKMEAALAKAGLFIDATDGMLRSRKGAIGNTEFEVESENGDVNATSNGNVNANSNSTNLLQTPIRRKRRVKIVETTSLQNTNTNTNTNNNNNNNNNNSPRSSRSNSTSSTSSNMSGAGGTANSTNQVAFSLFDPSTWY